MAKKKKSTKFEKDQVSNDICTMYGDMVRSGNEVLDKLKELAVISVSPSLDMALGGGIREGSCVVVTGDPKTGKSVTALSFAGNCQRFAGKKVYYFDTEGRVTKEHLTQIQGLSIEEDVFKIIGPTDEVPVVSAEMYLTTLEIYIKQVPNVVIIVDSVSNMLPMEELTGEIKTNIRNGLPRLMAMFLKRISGDVARTGAIVVFVTHNIANTGASSPRAKKKMSDSGNQLQYQVSTNIVITHKENWEVSGSVIGQKAHWVVHTSSAGGTPQSKAIGWIRYGVGIDRYQEIAQIATEVNLIAKSGSWYNMICATDNLEDKVIKKLLKKYEIDPEDTDAVSALFRCQGMKKIADLLEENESFSEWVYDKIKECYE